MYTATYGQLTDEFHYARLVATLGLSLFVMALGIGPTILGPLSEVGCSRKEENPALRWIRISLMAQDPYTPYPFHLP